MNPSGDHVLNRLASPLRCHVANTLDGHEVHTIVLFNVAGDLTIGELTAFLLYAGIVASSIGALAGVYADFMRAAGSSQRIFELLKEEQREAGATGGQVDRSGSPSRAASG